MAKSTEGLDYDFLFKLAFIGDGLVGKSSLLLRFAFNEFRLSRQATIGVEFAFRELIIDGKKIKTQVWDIGTLERFNTPIPQCCHISDGILVVFDLSSSASFDHITSWIEELHRHTPPDLPMILIGNKSDLVDRRKVSRKRATVLAEQLNIPYMETSALNASNVERAFTTLVTNIYHKKKLESVEDEPKVEISSTAAKQSGYCKTS